MNLPTILLRTVLAVLLGGVIGFERESKRRPAGFRTHTLVCVGASTVMLLSELLFMRYNAAYGVLSDPARMGAQVVSGIGFLGAGTIMRYGANVRGLTTAASIWATGCIGLAAGAGFYDLAVTAAVIILVTLILFSKAERRLEKRHTIHELQIELRDDAQTLGAVMLLLTAGDVKLLSILADTGDDSLPAGTRRICCTVQNHSRESAILTALILRIAALEGVLKAEAL